MQDAASGEKAALIRALPTSGMGFPAATETLALSLTQWNKYLQLGVSYQAVQCDRAGLGREAEAAED